jgi:L-alanine-DL-glutamate epimerase-like enolase superfamily enzyme
VPPQPEAVPEPAAEPADMIEALETAVVRMPLDERLAVHGARHVHAVSEFVVVRLRLRSGAYGYGEVSATRNWSGEDADSAVHFIRDVLASSLLGRPVHPVARLTALMDRALSGNPFTKAAVNTAAWDALGRSLGLPVAALLGGPYRTEIPVKISLSGDGERLEDCHAAARDKGFAAFKVKVGKDLTGDLARVRLARQLVGGETFLGADANGGWSRVQASRALPCLRDLGLAMIEQPVAAADVAGLASLRGAGLPVLVDESVYGPADLVRVLRQEAADGVSLYVGKSGGLEALVASAVLATHFGLDVVIGSNAEMGIGSAAMVHAAAACPRLGDTPSDIIGHHFYTEDTLEKPLDIDGRRAVLPPGPGLGVELRTDIVRRLR